MVPSVFAPERIFWLMVAVIILQLEMCLKMDMNGTHESTLMEK
jgi:hypothetical protein